MNRPRRPFLATGAALGALVIGAGTAAAADEDATGTVVIDVGAGFSPEVTVQLFDDVIVPGDDLHRSFQVRNDGPTDATMTVDVVEVVHVGEIDRFFSDLTINDIAVVDLLGTDTRLQEIPVELGEVVEVPVDVRLPVEATSGNRSEVGARGVSFHLRVTMRGDTPGGTSGHLPVAGPRAAPVALPQTGPDILTTLAVAAVLVSGGLLARHARRRFGADSPGAA